MTNPEQRPREEQVTNNKTPGALVSGASFAGLATAWWLHRLGFAVTIVELAGDLRRGGTPVNIREGVLDVVRRMGLLEEIKALALPPRPTVFLNEEGRPLRQQQGDHGEQPDQEPEEEYEIERDALLELLFNKVKEHAEFRFADSISTLHESEKAVDVTFTSGRTQSFALVFGCDGLHSTVRRLCFGEESSFVVFLKYYFSLTIVPRLLMPEDTSELLSIPGKTVMLNTYNGKTDIGFIFFSAEEISYDRRRQDEQKARIRAHFQNSGWRIPELLDEMTSSDVFYFDKLCQVHMPSWTKGRVALVGDAGYCPSPAAGMGGSVAILGAAALGEAMERHPEDLTTAFQDYNETFRPVIEAIQAQAVDFGIQMFMPASQEALQKRNEMLGLSEQR